LVSKNGLGGIVVQLDAIEPLIVNLVAVELEARRAGTAKLLYAAKELLATSVLTAADLSDGFGRDLHLVARPQSERLHMRTGKADREAVAPLRDFHEALRQDIRNERIS